MKYRQVIYPFKVVKFTLTLVAFLYLLTENEFDTHLCLNKYFSIVFKWAGISPTDMYPGD